MRRFGAALVAVMLAGAGEAAEAQPLPGLLGGIPLSLDARLGVAVPTGDFAAREPGIEAQPGVAFGIGAMLRLLPAVGLYAQYRQERYGCGECADVGFGDGAMSAGAEAGAQVSVPVPVAGLRPWVRGGAVWQALQIGDGEEHVASERGVGYALGGGVRVGFGPVVLLPGIHYRSYPAEFQFSAFPSRSVDVTHLVVDVGLALSF